MAAIYDLFAIGDASVDTYVRVPFIAGPDQKAIGEWAGVFGGGMAANFAAAATHAGASTRFMTVIGDDPAGEQLVQELAEHGVDTTDVQRRSGSVTFQCFVQLDPSGEKALFGAAPTVKVPELGSLPLNTMRRSHYVYLLADDLGWATSAAKMARASGARVAVDLERTAVDSGIKAACDLASLCGIVFTNVQAFSRAIGGNSDMIADVLLAAGAEMVVITDGSAGALVKDADQRLVVEGLHVPVIDSTGAGDAHNGSFLGSLLNGMTLHEALAVSTAMGALCVQHLGPRGYRNSLTDLPELVARARRTIHASHSQPQLEEKSCPRS